MGIFGEQSNPHPSPPFKVGVLFCFSSYRQLEQQHNIAWWGQGRKSFVKMLERLFRVKFRNHFCHRLQLFFRQSQSRRMFKSCFNFLGSCGVRPATRIVGGTDAKHGDWPWQAQVRTRSGFPYCGGSLVHPQWLVTASHCVGGKSPSSIVIR